MTKTQYGQVEAAFGYSFAAGSVVFGWMADRFAVHRVYAAVLALWSLAGMATGWAQDHQGLLQLFSDFSSMTALEAWAKIRGASFNL